MQQNKYEIDMTQGSLFKNVVLFSIPLMLSGLLQVFYNAADVIVVGHFAGSDSLAAVGSTGSLTNLMINMFIGLSIGTAVLVANGFGSRNSEKISRSVHTAITLSLISGVFLAVLGFFASKPALRLMGSPENVIGKSTLYMRIYFMGMPANMLFNFGSAILRSVGDTRRPLYFSIISGMVNVLLNLFFVIALHMDVAGVALATIISQMLSATLVVLCLIRADGAYKLNIHKLKIHKTELLEMMRIGLPAGLQGAMFSISNIIIQSSVNSFGSTVMAGQAASGNLASFIYIAQNAFQHTTLTATAQNYGAKNAKRIKKSLFVSSLSVSVVGLLIGFGILTFAKPLLAIYTKETAVVAAAVAILAIECPTHWICGLMETFVGALRGLGSSVTPMIVTLVGTCLLRIVWVYTIFANNHTIQTLFWSYPVSWFATTLMHLVCFIILYSKKKKEI